MKKLLTLLLLLLTTPVHANGKIVWLGASTVKGVGYGGVTTTDTFAYKVSIANGYAATDIVNAGVSSDDSGHMLARLSTDVLSFSPKVVVVNAGGLGDQTNSIPLVTYRNNITSIFLQLQTAGIKVVAVNDVLQRGTIASFAGLEPYMQAYEEIAQSMGITNIDIYREYAISYIYEDFTTVWNPRYVDSVHQTIIGNAWITSILTRPRYTGVFN